MSHPSEGLETQETKNLLTGLKALAMVLMHGEAILFKTGWLSAEGFEQFAAAVRRYWAGASQQAHNRFTVLSLDGQDRYFFTKQTSEQGLVLGLVFPLDTPLIRIQQEMKKFLGLVGELEVKHARDDAGLERSLQSIVQVAWEPDSPQADQPKPDGWQAEVQPSRQIEDAKVPEEPNRQPGPKHKGETNDMEQRSLPGERPTPSWGPLESKPPDEEDLASILQAGSTDRHEGEEIEDLLGSDPPVPLALAKPEGQHGETPEPLYQQAELALLAETVFDTTFYLVPRENEHYLLGELAQSLRQWMPMLCERYGWELSLLSVRPDYLKWTLVDFPECLTRDMLAVVRRCTTSNIFNAFPNLQQGDHQKDFWASGYLVDTLNREFPTQDLIAHVSKDRMR